MRPRGRPRGAMELSGEQIKAIIEGSIKGNSYTEIAKEADCSKNTVYRCKKDLELI